MTNEHEMISTSNEEKLQILALLIQGEKDIAAGVGRDYKDVLAEVDALLHSSASTQS